MHFQILNGDATQVDSDALVTLINSGKRWYGGMDRSIMRVAGDRFHREAALAIDSQTLTDGAALYVPDSSHKEHFKSVIFVVDDIRQPLDQLVISALDCALAHHARTITMPALRMGVAAGLFEKTPLETVAALHHGITTFEQQHPKADMTLIFVIYNDHPTVDLLKTRFLPPATG